MTENRGPSALGEQIDSSLTVEHLLSPEGKSRYSGDGQVKPTEEDSSFAAGRAARYPYAVRYQGAWETPWDGTCTAVRLHARAIAAAGLPVVLESFHRVQINQHGFPEPAHGNIARSVQEEVGELVTAECAVSLPTIKHLVVRDADHLRTTIMPRSVAVDTVGDPAELVRLRQSVYASTILFSVWERDRVERAIVNQLSRCGQVWVPCLQNRNMLAKSGVPEERLCVVPHPYDPASDICKLVRRRPSAERRFYSISGAWQPRKGYDRLLGAFLRAFRPSDAVCLTVKYNPSKWDGYPQPEEALARWLKDAEVRANGWSMSALAGKLQMIEGRLSPGEITKLHFQNNIYVCSSHGEAWCLPAFDAKCAGNRLVHVPYGGTADFDGPGDVRVPYHMAPAHPSYRWEPDAEWADYALADLVGALRSAAPPEKYERSADFEDCFTLSRCGDRMWALILFHLKEHFKKAYEHYRGLLPASDAERARDGS